MVIEREEIERRLALPLEDPKSLVITPLLPADQSFEPDAVDLRLGSDFLVSRSDRLAVNVPGYAHGVEFQRAIHVPIGRYYILPGHHAVLAATLQFIKLPTDLAAMVLTKSSWARTFITVETAPWVHPSYRGCLTLEIANVSETPLTLFPGQRIAQLVFFQIQGTAIGDGKPTGSYVGAVRPEAPHFKPPEVVLSKELGIDPRHVSLPWSRHVKNSPQAVCNSPEAGTDDNGGADVSAAERGT